MPVSRLPLVLVVLAMLVAAPQALAAAGDTSRYVLTPGNYGGIPTTDQSRDQLPLYSGLTPLRRNVGFDDIQRLFLPMDFKPIGPTRVGAHPAHGRDHHLRLAWHPAHQGEDASGAHVRGRLGDGP